MTIAGQATTWTRVGDSGMKIDFHFCPTCGSTVYYEIDQLPEFVAVPVGAFADPEFAAPTFSVYEARKHAWVQVPNSAEHMD